MRMLVRDVLDKQLLDRNRENCGKVDGIVIQLRSGRRPRVAAIEVGAVTLARRIHPWLERRIASLERRLGIGDGTGHRIPWSKVAVLGRDVHIDLDAARSRLMSWERWARAIVVRIPGGR